MENKLYFCSTVHAVFSLQILGRFCQMLRAARQGDESRLCWQDRTEIDAHKTTSEGKGTN